MGSPCASMYSQQLSRYFANPRRKYWDKRGNAQRAIDDYNQHAGDPRFNKNRGKYRQVELVVFELVEVKK